MYDYIFDWTLIKLERVFCIKNMPTDDCIRRESRGKARHKMRKKRRIRIM
jgi:hypothetical protein